MWAVRRSLAIMPAAAAAPTRFVPAKRRTIATATYPCCRARSSKRTSRKMRFRGEPPHLHSSRIQERIQELRNQLAEPHANQEEMASKTTTTTLPPRDIPMARVTKKRLLGGVERLPKEVFKLRNKQLMQDLLSWELELHNVDKERLDREIHLIRSGKRSNREAIAAIQSSLHKIPKTDRRAIQHVLDWFKSTSVDGFQSRFDETFPQLSADAQRIILDEVTAIPLEDYASVGERMERAMLDAFGSARREEFYRRKCDLYSRVYERFGQDCTQGNSMLPTLSNPSRVLITPLFPEETNVLEQLQVGNVVKFIVYFNTGDVRFLAKRLVGMPGDVVQNPQGKLLRVPEGCFWAVGDNLQNSYDSRHFGAVPAQNLNGKYILTFSLFPPRLQFLG